MYLLINLYDKKSKVISEQEAFEWTEGINPKKGDRFVWDCEEYIVVKL